MEQGNETEGYAPAAAGRGAMRGVTAGSKSSYCNVANANATRETVILNFGLSQNAERRGAELGIDLLHRVVVSPLVAKHLHDLLSKLMAEYDAHYGNPR
jgi:Protein of unknown function (DUF3467)